MERILEVLVVSVAKDHPAVALALLILSALVAGATGVSNAFGQDTEKYTPRVEALIRICGYVGVFVRGISRWTKQLWTGERQPANDKAE